MIVLLLVVIFMIIANNSWKMYLALRQLLVCRKSKETPSVLSNVISKESMEEARLIEMHNVELQIWSQIVDMVCSCIEIPVGLYPALWKATISSYSGISDKTWLSVFFVFLYTVYVVVRYIPVLVYNKIVLEPKYRIPKQETAPLIGMLCVLAFSIVFVQILLAPLTFIIVAIEEYGGYFFFLWFWVFAVVLSMVLFIVLTSCNLFFFGKQDRLAESFLMDQIERVTDIAKFPISRVYLLYTYHLRRGTAYVSGCCCCKRLLIVDTMVSTYTTHASFTSDVLAQGLGLNDIQVAAMVAHALGHWKYWHIHIVYIIFAFLMLCWMLIFGLCFYYVPIFELVGFKDGENPNIVAYVIMFKYLLPTCATIVTPLLFFILRSLEYKADQYVYRIGFGRELIAGSIKLFGDFMTYPFVDRLYMVWNRRKPPILDRVSYLKSAISK